MQNNSEAKWRLTFSDEFDRAEIDGNRWYYPYAPYHIGEDRFAYCCDNLSVEDGCLVIRATRNPIEVNGKELPYRAAALKTMHRFAQRYGRFEARISFDDKDGIIPAFWLMPRQVPQLEQNFLGIGGYGAEVDIMEHIYAWRDSTSHNVHWGGYGEEHINAGGLFPALQEPWGWHTYALEWDEEGYRFLVDGALTGEYTGGVASAPEYVLLSMAVGGWGGTPQDDELPACMRVDWIRVYEKA